MIIHEMQQGSEEWFRIRLARPTASRFKDILTKPRNKADLISKTAETYLDECFAEYVIGEPLEGFSSPWMDRGQELEEQALRYYKMFVAPEGAEVKPVGFVTLSGDQLSPGCSPDALVGDDGGVELKLHGAKYQVGFMRRPDRFLKEHYAQVQGGLWITGREWWDLLAYNPALKPVLHHVRRDETYIAELVERVATFTVQLQDALVEWGYRTEAT